MYYSIFLLNSFLLTYKATCTCSWQHRLAGVCNEVNDFLTCMILYIPLGTIIYQVLFCCSLSLERGWRFTKHQRNTPYAHQYHEGLLVHTSTHHTPKRLTMIDTIVNSTSLYNKMVSGRQHASCNWRQLGRNLTHTMGGGQVGTLKWWRQVVSLNLKKPSSMLFELRVE